jgi:CobQ-like glutamine amidotransferase family enzyme
MTRLYSFQPHYFNNNGDQGNLEVITSAIRASGSSFSVVNEPSNADFVLIGDCSIAVAAKYESELRELVPTLSVRLESGLPTLLVGRSYELLASDLGIELDFTDRVSAFVSEQDGDSEIWGYHNSLVSSPKVFRKGNFIATTLFGPLLAKNPHVLKSMVGAMGVEIKLEWMGALEALAAKARSNTTFG